MDDRTRAGSERIPPGQYVTDKWPVLTFGPTPEVDLDGWTLTISGLVADEKVFNWQEFQSLPRVEVKSDFHCVTRFSTLENRWGGVSTRSLLESLDVDPAAVAVMVKCFGGYTTNLPLEDFLSTRALLADSHNGEALAREHGGPVRLVVPHLYAWKSAKWISGIELQSVENRGFWEENGYHLYGDPWREERFSSQEISRAHQARRRARDLGIVPGEPGPATSGESSSET